MQRLILAKQLDDLVVNWLVEHGGLPPWAEKARPDAAEKKIEAATRKLHRKIEGVFANGLDRLAAEMDRRGWPGSPEIRRRLIQEHLAAERRPFQDVVVDAAIQAADLGRVLTLDDLKDAGVSVVFEKFSSPFVRLLRETTFTASSDTMDRIIGDVDDVMATLADQVAQGAGIPEATRALRDVFNGLQENRLEAISQTEINSAQNTGAHRTMVDLGVSFKQWLTSGLPGIRDTHRSQHGVVVRVGERYPNGLLHPGDRGGPIKEWIRCRCRERPYIPRRGEVITATPYYP